MALTVRLYLFEEGGAIKRIARRVAEGFTYGQDAIPAYAGTRQRVLEVVVENDSGKPTAIVHTNGYFLEFDAEGRVDESLRQTLVAAMNMAFPAERDEGNVVSLSPRRERQVWETKHRWKPTKNDLDRIIADLSLRRGVKGFESVVGVATKRPTLSYEAKSALNEVGSKFSMCAWHIGQVTEKALPGLIFEARARAKAQPEDQFFWEAVALEGERQQELKRLRRTGKGKWIALFQVWKHTGPSAMEEFFVEHRECEGESDAIDAMKELIRQHHEKAGPAMSIEARTMPDLEWRLLNDRPM